MLLVSGAALSASMSAGASPVLETLLLRLTSSVTPARVDQTLFGSGGAVKVDSESMV